MALTQVTSIGLKDGEIVNADLHSAAAIAVSKLSGVMPLAGGTLTGDTTLANTKKVIFNHSSGAGAFIKHQSGHFEIISSVGNTYFASAGTLYLRTNGSTNALTLDTSQNATFEGWVHLKDNKALYIGSANDLSLFHDATDCRIRYNHAVGSLKFQKNDNSNVLTLDGSGNATFTGSISGSNLTLTHGDPKINFVDSGDNPDYQVVVNAGHFMIKDATSSADRLYINASSTTITNRLDVRGNVDINGTPPWTVAGGDYRNLSISGQVANSGGFLWLGNGTATTNGDFDLGRINFCNGATITSQIAGTTQTSANDDGRISFHTKATGGSLAERLRITNSKVMFSVDAKVDGDNTRDLGASGARWRNLHLGTSARIGATGTTASTAGDDLVIEGSSDRGLSIISGTGSSANIYFGDSSDADVGRIAYQHNDNALDFSVNARTTALRIDQGGVQNYTGSSADNRYANVQVRHKTPYSTDGGYPGSTQSSTNQTVFSLYNESYGGNRMAFRSGQGHQFEIETKTRDLGSGSYNDADVYFRGQYDGALTDRYIIESGGAHIWKVRNGDTALNIDGNGVVKKPEHPYFVAQRSSVISSTGYQTFNTSVYNNGNHYSTSTGKFTAPTAGLYHFFCKINAYKRIDFQIRKNGTTSGSTGREIGQFNTSNQNGWYSHIVQRTFELASNDYVEIYVSNLTQNTDPGEWLTFQGYLIG